MNNLQQLICSFVILSIETSNNIRQSDFGDSRDILKLEVKCSHYKGNPYSVLQCFSTLGEIQCPGHPSPNELESFRVCDLCISIKNKQTNKQETLQVMLIAVRVEICFHLLEGTHFTLMDVKCNPNYKFIIRKIIPISYTRCQGTDFKWVKVISRDCDHNISS